MTTTPSGRPRAGTPYIKGGAEPRPLHRKKEREKNAREREERHDVLLRETAKAKAAEIKLTTARLEQFISKWELIFEKTIGGMATAAPALLEKSIENALNGDRQERQFLLKLLVQLARMKPETAARVSSQADKLRQIADKAARGADAFDETG
jgi:hypothetical protein